MQYRPGGFQILPPLVKNLIIINGLVYLAQLTVERVAPQSAILNNFALNQWKSGGFGLYQYITYMFMHSMYGSGHLIMNMFALWMFGSELERIWGPKRFLIFYLVCGIGGGLLNNLVHWVEFERIVRSVGDISALTPDDPVIDQLRATMRRSIGASAAVFGLLAAFAYLFPNSYIYIYFIVPIKTKWFVLLYGGIELVLAFLKLDNDMIDHWGHIGGALTGLLLVYAGNKNNRKSFY
jgi:membrane associated rhomboid family serine protease